MWFGEGGEIRKEAESNSRHYPLVYFARGGGHRQFPDEHKFFTINAFFCLTGEKKKKTVLYQCMVCISRKSTGQHNFEGLNFHRTEPGENFKSLTGCPELSLLISMPKHLWIF